MKCMKCYEYKICHVHVEITKQIGGRLKRMIISLSALNQVQRLRSMPLNAYSHWMAPNP